MLRNKKKIIVTLLVIFVLVSGYYAMSRLRWPDEEEFQGVFTCAFENQDFRPDNSLEHWWLDGHEILEETIFQDLSKRKVNWEVEEPLYKIKLYGRLSPIGEHGHFGMWRRSLKIIRMIEYEYIGNKSL